MPWRTSRTLRSSPCVTVVLASSEDRSFEQAGPELMRNWDHAKGIASLTREGARLAIRDAWQHASDFIQRATPGDSDHDGK